MTKKRVHKTPEQRKDEILAAATAVFAERGYQVADTQAIADKACVGKGTLYRYFPTKENLFREALRRHLDILSEKLINARDQHSNPLLKLKAAMGAYFLFFQEYPETIELFAQERAEFGSKVTPLYFERMMQSRDEWRGLYKDICTQFPVRDVSIDDMMARGRELMHGATYTICNNDGSSGAYAQLDAIFEFYLFGILNHPNPTQLLL